MMAIEAFTSLQQGAVLDAILVFKL